MKIIDGKQYFSKRFVQGFALFHLVGGILMGIMIMELCK